MVICAAEPQLSVLEVDGRQGMIVTVLLVSVTKVSPNHGTIYRSMHQTAFQEWSLERPGVRPQHSALVCSERRDEQQCYPGRYHNASECIQRMITVEPGVLRIDTVKVRLTVLPRSVCVTFLEPNLPNCVSMWACVGDNKGCNQTLSSVVVLASIGL